VLLKIAMVSSRLGSDLQRQRHLDFEIRDPVLTVATRLHMRRETLRKPNEKKKMQFYNIQKSKLPIFIASTF
jgi:hypothetical protein